MSSNYDKEMELTFKAAQQLARDRKHKVVIPEHILAALMDNTSARVAVEACDADPDKIKQILIEHLDTGCDDLQEDGVDDPQLDPVSLSLQKKAHISKTAFGGKALDGASFLIAILMVSSCYGYMVLQRFGVERYHVVNWVQHDQRKSDAIKARSRELAFADGDAKPKAPGKNTALQQYAVNLNEQAEAGHVDRLIGREAEIDRTVKILSRCTKNNPVFVGDAGVGKTAVAEGLAYRIVHKQVPASLQDCVVHALDMTALISGTRYRGDFEERMQEVIKEAKADKNIILFIDEIHTVMGAGSSQSSIDAANILKPVLARGKIRCMGATTLKEYRQYFEVDAAMARRFQMVDVDEPSTDEALKILKGLTQKYGKHHGVEYAPEALEAAVKLSVRYMPSRRLPDKAIDVMDEAGSIYSAVMREEDAPTPLVTEEDIRTTVSLMTRIPINAATATERETMKALRETLSLSVFGQDEAVDTLQKAIKIARSGLRDPRKPLGSYLFVGPSGVGKTELTRQLAEAMGLTLARFDMSEYMEKHSASRLIGAPPGYVGHGTGGLLTETVNKTPHCVLLLDEIEKAHPDIFNLLLQVMDYGTMTDSSGRKVDFRNTIIIMTSNVGAEAAAKESIGFLKQDDAGVPDDALQMAFPAAFRSRLDAVVKFRALPQTAVTLVVDKLVCEMEALLKDKHVTISLTDEARNWIAKKGYSRELGARPVENVITDHIRMPLAEEILYGSLEQGGSVTVDVSEDGAELKLSYQPAGMPALIPAQ